MAINKALLKHGYYKFSLEILEYCEAKDAIELEDYYLQLLSPEYNILKKAGSSLGFKHSEETLAKMRGRKHSEEARLLISAAVSKFNVSSKGIAIEVTNIETGITTEYPSIYEAAKALNCSDSAIWYNLRSLKQNLTKEDIFLKKLQ